jgi:hypothetical protein
MIQSYFKLLEYTARKRNGLPEKKVRAANSLRALFSEIDFSAETIPENNPEKMTALLTFIKGKKLAPDEQELLGELFAAKGR